MDWLFLLRVLEVFGFNKRFQDLIFMLVLLASFSVLVNGSPTSFFKASRGLRQGDSISPILFIILAKCLGDLWIIWC